MANPTNTTNISEAQAKAEEQARLEAEAKEKAEAEAKAKLEDEEQKKKEAQAKAGSDKDKSKKDKSEVRMMNVTNRTFNRIKFREIIKVKKQYAQYYLDNGFNYFNEVVGQKKEESASTPDQASAPAVGNATDEVDDILNNL